MSDAPLSGVVAIRGAGESRATPRPSNQPRVPDSAIAGVDPLEALEGRWTLRILCRLNRGKQRFADLRAAIPRVSANILTDRLRALEGAGLVERRHLPPPHASQVYALSEAGGTLAPVLDALARWRSAPCGMAAATHATD